MNKEEKEENVKQTTGEAVADAANNGSEETFRPRHRRHRRGSANSGDTEQLQQLGTKLSELNDKYLRLMAEYENYRRRTTAEKAELILSGGKDVIKSVLPIIDDLERALRDMTDENAKEGVTMIYNKLMNTLGQKGLKPIESKGKEFDENFHEAVMQVPASEEAPKGAVVDVVEKGYFLNEKVLRHAKVVVAV